MSSNWDKIHPEKMNEYRRRWVINNHAKVKLSKEKHNLKRREIRALNPKRKKPRLKAEQANQKTYLSDRPCLRGHTGPRYTATGQCIQCYGFYTTRTRRVRIATPKWLTKDQRLEIAYYYEQARRLSIRFGVKQDVDHVVPLKGITVCGLHVPWNLRIMPRSWNRKRAKRWKVGVGSFEQFDLR